MATALALAPVQERPKHRQPPTEEPAMSTSTVEYENRIVVFLDFLGFKDHIERSITDPAHATRIARAFETIREFTVPEERWPNREVTQFSDCVVVSYSAVEQSAVFDLLLTILLLQVELAGRGFLVRGGITVGPLVHQAGFVFGPAMVEAHRLESNDAIYPRILVDPELVNIARDYPALHHSGNDEARYAEEFLTEDPDGKHYLEYISWDAVVEGAGADSDDGPGYMLALSRILKRGLASDDPRVLTKMLWLHREYRAALDHFFVPPRPPEVIARDPEYYDALTDLPRLDAEAAAAVSKDAASTT